MKGNIFWDLTPYILVEILQLFGTKLLSLSAAMKVKTASSHEMFVSLVLAMNLDGLTMN
jgi:hypothetical protein